jgi:hypothetical protein
MAMRLAKAFGATAEFWLRLQMQRPLGCPPDADAPGLERPGGRLTAQLRAFARTDLGPAITAAGDLEWVHRGKNAPELDRAR